MGQDPEELARAHAQFARWRAGAREATEVLLSSGRLTALGQHFAETMLRTLDALCRLPVPAEAGRPRPAAGVWPWPPSTAWSGCAGTECRRRCRSEGHGHGPAGLLSSPERPRGRTGKLRYGL
nr:hypothetical protein [Streptomyces swartbergensis]